MKPNEKELERRMGFAREKAAQIWCEPECSSIVMDTVLAEAFAKVLVKEMYEPHLGCATTRAIADELVARCGDPYDYTTIGDK